MGMSGISIFLQKLLLKFRYLMYFSVILCNEATLSMVLQKKT